MATKKKTTTKPTLTVEKVETLAPEPVAPTPVGGVNGHIHQWQAGGSIRDGEFIVILGPSGCGKSTLLRLIAGLEEITAGEIAIDAKVVNRLEPADRDIAMVFQNYALYPHMSVFNNMAYGLKIRRMPKDEIESRVHNAARILELTEYLDRKPRQLSGGQRQRVAIARATISQPRVILADEPTGNLDRASGNDVIETIEGLNRAGMTVVIVTHDPELGQRTGRQVRMLDGRIADDRRRTA
jgi:sn-glycerol 3-phosphate transport system ATP-binding protein